MLTLKNSYLLLKIYFNISDSINETNVKNKENIGVFSRDKNYSFENKDLFCAR